MSQKSISCLFIFLFAVLMVLEPVGFIPGVGLPAVNLAHAATFTVTKMADTNDGTCDADCSLREAINTASMSPTPHEVTFKLHDADQMNGLWTINLATPLTRLFGGLTLTGPGANQLVVRGNYESAYPSYPVLWVVSGATGVTISGLTISNGGTSGQGLGGGIRNEGGLTLRRCVISANEAAQGAGIYNGAGTLTLEDCTISDNQAIMGAAICNMDGRVSLLNCTLSGNLADNPSTATGSALFQGTSTQYGHSETVMQHCTVTNNTRSGNAYSGGGVLYIHRGTAALKNCIVAGNIYSVGSEGISGAYTDQGFNILSGDPKLTPLQDNGGPTPTHGLLPGSPALNAGDPNFVAPPSFDQRGTGFPRVQGGRIDAGSFEGTITAPVAFPQAVVAEKNVAKTITLTATNVNTDTVIYAITRLPERGTLKVGDAVLSAPGIITGNQVTYTSVVGQVTTDSFSFNVRDAGLTSQAATVSLTLTNTTPGAYTVHSATDKNTPVGITLKATDANNDPLTFHIVTLPQYGTLSIGGTPLTAPGPIAGNQLVFTPDPNFVGWADFRFRAHDGTAYSNDALSFISVTEPGSLVVNTTADSNVVGDGKTSLREAIAYAVAREGVEDVITFALPEAQKLEGRWTISLNAALPDLRDFSLLTIKGPGAKLLTVQPTAGGTYRILSVYGSALLQGMTIANSRSLGVFSGEGSHLTLQECTLTGHRSPPNANGAALYNVGGILTVQSCLIRNNATAGFGGGIFNYGYNGTLTVQNSTLSGNSGHGAGLANLGGVATVLNCTITNNSGGTGGGIYASGPVQINNSIVAGNTATTDPNISGSYTHLGYNLLVGDPRLGPLQDNGGPTFTHALLAGSPAWNAGQPGFTSLTTDQRGNGYNRVESGRVDLGAFEKQVPPTIFINDLTLTEGTGTNINANFTVSLSFASLQIISVNALTANGTAKSPADFTAIGQTLSFTPGQTTKTFSVPIVGDSLDEDNETLFVILSSPVNATILRGRGIGTVADNDVAPTISIENLSIKEYNAGQTTAAFRLSLSQPSGKAVRVTYGTAVGTATTGNDYVAVPSTQITFNVGQTVTLARVLVNGDLLNEPNETFLVNLNFPINGTLADSQAIGNILDDDSAPGLSINDVGIVEGNSGTKQLTFTVTLSKASGQSISVNYATANGTARSGVDYVAKSGTLIFAPGSALMQTISVVINGETLVESDETLYMLLTGAGNANIGRARGVGTIINDDSSQ